MSKLPNEYTAISFKNQAPTTEDKTHHEYYFYIHPLNHGKPFMLGESIGGGHAERGGSITLSLEELLQYNNWKEHLEKSDCAWAIEVIEQYQPDIERIIDILISRKRGWVH
ncbi:hypothetical protein [Chitinophaga sp. CF418]|uniref:hypothetical protein n=1 Tax=Chitinophaga sp. CF418 TaxID=1855287 RepID=UPI00091E522C|nr:hypothetical protein [Chitinophaga sp. CF418]SHN37831.1 hypothetical protein SAMN05216311_110309 [Chitinophaga sp. CF418]